MAVGGGVYRKGRETESRVESLEHRSREENRRTKTVGGAPSIKSPLARGLGSRSEAPVAIAASRRH